LRRHAGSITTDLDEKAENVVQYVIQGRFSQSQQIIIQYDSTAMVAVCQLGFTPTGRPGVDHGTKAGDQPGIKYTGVRSVLTTLCDDIKAGKKPTTYDTSFGEGVLGLAPNRIIVLSGGAGTGKTSLGMSCVFDVLHKRSDSRVVVCDVEMSAEELLEREVSRLSGVPLVAIQDRCLTHEQRRDVDEAHGRLQGVQDRLCIMPPPFDTFHILEAVEYFGADMLLVDYIQELDYPQGCERRHAIDDALREFRKLRLRGKCIILLSEITAGSQTTPPHLKESGQIEYDADNVYMIKRTKTKPQDVTLKHTKARRGKPKDVQLTFRGEFHRWTAAASGGVA
jgi:hypothetical protein